MDKETKDIIELYEKLIIEQQKVIEDLQDKLKNPFLFMSDNENYYVLSKITGKIHKIPMGRKLDLALNNKINKWKREGLL